MDENKNSVQFENANGSGKQSDDDMYSRLIVSILESVLVCRVYRRAFGFGEPCQAKQQGRANRHLP
jgi:hypothetical protein